MVRTVRVDLEANVGQYTAPVEDAKVKTEELDRKVEALDRDLNKIPADSAKAAASLRLLGDETGKAGVALDDLGKKSTSLGAIDQQIAKTRSEIRGLADEFNRTGSSSSLSMLFGKQDDLKRLERLKKDLEDPLGQAGTQGGKSFLSSFWQTVSGWFDGLGGKLMTGLIVAAIAGAFALGSGPLLAVGGLGGIATGIIGQLHDPAVHQAITDLGHQVMATLTEATSPFRDPLIKSVGIFQAALQQAIRSIDFTSLSKLLTPLAAGLGGLLTNMMPGFNKALEAAGPVLQALAQELPKLGGAISDMFAQFARSKDGAIIAIKLIVDGLRTMFEAIGQIVHAGAKLTEWADTGLSKFLGWVAKGADAVGMKGLAGGAEQVKQKLDNLKNIDVSGLGNVAVAAVQANTDLNALNQKLGETAVTADTLAGKMVDLAFNKLMAVDRGALGVAESLTKLTESFQQNGRSIDIHTAKGQANRGAIMDAITANMQLYQAQIASGMSAVDAAHNYDDNTKALEDQLKKAGLTKQQIDGLIGSYRQIPDKVNSIIAIQGLTDAINHLSDLLSMIYGINGKSFSFKITENYVRQVSGTLDRLNAGYGNRWGGAYEHAASGLLRDAKVFSPVGPARYAFAEPQTGGEAFVPRFGDYTRSTSILDTAARWYGGRFAPGGWAGGAPGAVVNLTVHAGMGTDGAALGAQIAEKLRPYINSVGGNVQQALGRRGQ